MENYKRTDFRAFDVLAEAIIYTTPGQLDEAIQSCADIAGDQTFRPDKRLLFRGFANLLRLYRRKYAIRETFASKSEQRRVEHQRRSK